MRSSVIVVAVVVFAALVGTASAQPGMTPPSASPPEARPGSYRPAAAFFVSLGVDVGMLIAAQKGAFDDHEGLGLAMLVIAPSAGRWTIGEVGILGMGMRLAGLGLIAKGIGGDEGVPIIGGTVLVVSGIFYDMIGAPISADRKNERRWKARPTAIASPGGTLSPGLAFGGSF